MAEDGRVRVFDRLDDAVGLFFRAHPEFAVHAGDHQIEGFQDVFGIIERAIAENVGFDFP